jgi:putative transcriptional regulator
MRIRVTLKEELAKRGRTAYWLCVATGKAPASIYALVRDDQQAVYFELLEAVCEALECEPGDILKIEEGERHQPKKGKPANRAHFPEKALAAARERKRKAGEEAAMTPLTPMTVKAVNPVNDTLDTPDMSTLSRSRREP